MKSAVMTAIRIHYATKGDPELADPELPKILAAALGMTFYEFVRLTLDKTKRAIKGWSVKSYMFESSQPIIQ